MTSDYTCLIRKPDGKIYQAAYRVTCECAHGVEFTGDADEPFIVHTSDEGAPYLVETVWEQEIK